MTEMDKLQKYLEENHISFERVSPVAEGPDKDRNQIGVPNLGSNKRWDVICQPGSYGYHHGLLELAGVLVTPEEMQYDCVIGNLTAEDVIKRIESQGGNLGWTI